MKTFISSLLALPMFIFSVNADTLQQDSLKTRQRDIMQGDTIVEESGDTLVMAVVDRWHTYKVESDISYTPESFSDGGDLYRLTQNIYASFLVYIGASTNAFTPRDRYAYVIGDEEDVNNVRIYYTDSLKTIPMDAVKSIEVTKENPLKMYWTHEDVCVIRVGLKDRELYERVTYLPRAVTPEE